MSAIAYGIVIVLSGNCILLLRKKRAIYSNRMRHFLPIYVTVMFLLSTEALVQSIWLLRSTIFEGKGLPFIGVSPLAIPLTIWGADGIMVSIIFLTRTDILMRFQLQIWRCVILYQDVARGPWILVIVLLSLLSAVSLGRSIFKFSFPLAQETPVCGVMMFLRYPHQPLIIFSTVVNIILALLIIHRLVHHKQYIQKVLGAEHGSTYSKVIAMCIESSALMVIFGSICIVLGSLNENGLFIPLLLFPHTCVSGLKFYDACLRIFVRNVILFQVIPPLLIIYRVANGRGATTTLRLSEVGEIRFNNSASSPSSQGEV